ncbi:MAG: HEAT repeat domain-containing protein [Planctomycetes bacterium]|nr:HEAT repeat domain-containing protein [Planctomycetota bacterium]
MLKKLVIAFCLILVITGFVFSQMQQLEIEIFPEPAAPTPSTSQGNMSTCADFNNIKSLWTASVNFKPVGKEGLEEKRKTTQQQLDTYVKSMEKNSFSGRWVRNFLESEFDNLFLFIGCREKLLQDKNIPEDESINAFKKELNFCYEGVKTLETFKEYDWWMGEMIENRCQRAFQTVRKTSFKKKLSTLNLNTEQYKEFIIKIIDGLFDYKQKIKPSAKPATLGKTKEPLKDVKIKTPKGQWTEHKREGNELFETDILEITAKEEQKIMLADRRYIVLEAEAIMTGWEIYPAIPETLNKDIARLIELLNADDWETRENATNELISIGEPTISAVEKACAHVEPEVRMRANYILKKIKRGNVDEQVRAVLEPYLKTGRYPNGQEWKQLTEQLLSLGEAARIIEVLEIIQGEQAQNTQQWYIMQQFLQMIRPRMRR